MRDDPFDPFDVLDEIRSAGDNTTEATGLGDAIEELARRGDSRPLRQRLVRIVERYKDLGDLIDDTALEDYDERWRYEAKRAALVEDLIAELRSTVLGLGRWEAGR